MKLVCTRDCEVGFLFSFSFFPPSFFKSFWSRHSEVGLSRDLLKSGTSRVGRFAIDRAINERAPHWPERNSVYRQR
jgi:hypothetical protein